MGKQEHTSDEHWPIKRFQPPSAATIDSFSSEEVVGQWTDWRRLRLCQKYQAVCTWWHWVQNL